MRIETKFDIGQKVYYICGNRVRCDKILDFRIAINAEKEVEIRYTLDSDWPTQYEHELYATKEGLVKSL